MDQSRHHWDNRYNNTSRTGVNMQAKYAIYVFYLIKRDIVLGWLGCSLFLFDLARADVTDLDAGLVDWIVDFPQQ